MTPNRIAAASVDASNAALAAAVHADYAALGEQLARRNLDIDVIKAQAGTFAVALPSWGLGTGGTRFARFPGSGEPRHVHDKVQDCGVVHRLTCATPTVSPHLPWDTVSDYRALREHAASFGLGFDCVNSNTFQDQPGQPLSYKFGSLSHADPATRRQAVEHNLECLAIGRQLGARALTVWVGDGANFAGQSNFTRSFERYLDSCRQIYAALPDDWAMYLEHKMFEPAFYATMRWRPPARSSAPTRPTWRRCWPCCASSAAAPSIRLPPTGPTATARAWAHCVPPCAAAVAASSDGRHPTNQPRNA